MYRPHHNRFHNPNVEDDARLLGYTAGVELILLGALFASHAVIPVAGIYLGIKYFVGGIALEALGITSIELTHARFFQTATASERETTPPGDPAITPHLHSF